MPTLGLQPGGIQQAKAAHAGSQKQIQKENDHVEEIVSAGGSLVDLCSMQYRSGTK